jgi:hypothetical protein
MTLQTFIIGLGVTACSFPIIGTVRFGKTFWTKPAMIYCTIMAVVYCYALTTMHG